MSNKDRIKRKRKLLQLVDKVLSFIENLPIEEQKEYYNLFITLEEWADDIAGS